jgi:hypothetical protein
MDQDYFALVKGQDKKLSFTLIFTLILANMIPDYPILIHWHFLASFNSTLLIVFVPIPQSRYFLQTMHRTLIMLQVLYFPMLSLK